MIEGCETIINCSGIGLAKLKQQKGANEIFIKKLIESLPLNGVKKYRLLHLSSIKAFNPNNYQDIYSSDKLKVEQILLNNENKLCGELLRLPAVFGKNDKNLSHLLYLSWIQVRTAIESIF